MSKEADIAAMFAAMVEQGEAVAPPLPAPLPTRAELIARYGPPSIVEAHRLAWWQGFRFIELNEFAKTFRDEMREEPGI